MYNAMPIGPRPYLANGQGYNKENESEEKTQDSLHQNAGGRGQNQQQNRQNQQQQNQGRPQAQTAQPAPRPSRRHLPPPDNSGLPRNNVGVPSGMAPQRPAQMAPQPVQQNQPTVYEPIGQNVGTNRPQEIPDAQPVQEVQADAPEEKSKIMSAKSNKINIAQILKDFYNTIDAIGTPGIIRDEVGDYLKEVETHCKGDAPSIEFVQTDLRNAAILLDKYISETLNKDSKVVTKWLEALFLQRINYRYNDGEINQAFLVKFPGDDKKKQNEQIEEAREDTAPEQEPAQYEPLVEEPQPQRVVAQQPVTSPIRDYRPQPQPQAIVQQQHPQPQPKKQKPKPRRRVKNEVVIIPQDDELKSLFVQAKKQMFANNESKAMLLFHNALIRAQKIKDNETESKICLEMGKIYDNNNYIVQALSSYNHSLKQTTDNHLKTKAHYSMAQIYDDVNQAEPAIKHYLTSVSYAGENDNLTAQCTSLTRIANIIMSQSNQKAFDFYEEANTIVEQTDDAKAKGFVTSNTAAAYNRFDKPEKALSYYASAVKNYTEANSQDNIAENYKAAAELMLDYNNPAKAKVLLKKALVRSDKIKDATLIDEINELLAEIG